MFTGFPMAWVSETRSLPWGSPPKSMCCPVFEVALAAASQNERDVTARVTVAYAELVDPNHDGVVEQGVVALLNAIHQAEQVSELLRVPPC